MNNDDPEDTPTTDVSDAQLTYLRMVRELAGKYPDRSEAEWRALLEQARAQIDERNADLIAEAERILREGPDVF